MNKPVFDLEEAQVELEQVNNLLRIFSEFCDDECPSEDVNGMSTTSAVVFCARTQQYMSLIGAAQDKIIHMVEQMGTAIENYYNAKKGGVA